jgi:galactose mutarotase-like enzyme
MIWGILMLSTDVSSAEERYSIGKAVSSDTSKTPLILLSDGKAQIEAAIAPSKGGELSGLKVRHGGRWVETLYLARDYSPRESWTGKAPFLFPATGRNFPPDLEARRKAGETFNDGAYLLEGKRYSMPIHGFVRDLPWNVTKTQSLAGGAVAKLTLSDTPATRKWYPFGFAIDVDYTLADGALSIAYHIRADKENRSPMPFSVGNHITFVCPLIPGSDPEEMELVTPSKTELLKTSYGLPTGKSRPRSHAEGITLGRFERLKAVSLTRYAGKPSILLRDPQGLAIRMSHTASQTPQQPVILYNIWGDAKGGFFSTEPWVGLQNSLVLGKGLVHLKPGRDFTWTIRIEFEHKSGD